MIQYSLVYVSVLNEYSHLTTIFLETVHVQKKSIARCCDDAITMVRWRDTDGAIEHRASLPLYYRIKRATTTETRARQMTEVRYLESVLDWALRSWVALYDRREMLIIQWSLRYRKKNEKKKWNNKNVNMKIF